MTTLRLDFATLGAAAARVDLIRANFAQAQDIAHDTAELTGHAGLAERVHDFADSWVVSRARLSGHLERLSGALRAIEETFAQLDLGLRDEATGERAAAGGGR